MTTATPKPRAGEQWLDEVVVVTGETPRTDALFRTNNEWLEFARQLERELAAAAKDIKLWAANWEAIKAERDLLREALQTIANLALAPMVDMADPPEDRARDWSHVAALAWETARSALAKHGR